MAYNQFQSTLNKKFDKITKTARKRITSIMKEENKVFIKAISSKAPIGFWAYDYNNEFKAESEHSYAHWRSDVVDNGGKITSSVWNDTPSVRGYNYVRGIALHDTSKQTSSTEFKQLLKNRNDNIRAKIKKIGGIK